MSAILITIQGWTQVFLAERLRGRRNAFQCVAHSLITDVREDVCCKLSPRELGREEGRDEVNRTVEEELLKVIQWVGNRAQWFNNCFLLRVPLNHGFSNVSPQSAFRCSPETVFSERQARYHISWADTPCLLQPCYPLRAAWHVIPGLSWLGISLAGLWLQFLMRRLHIWRRAYQRGKNVKLSCWGNERFKQSRSLSFRRVQIVSKVEL